MDERRPGDRRSTRDIVVPPPPPRSPNDPANLPPSSSLIPYGNPKALTSYYLGIFSLVPFIGAFLGVAAIVFGFQGLSAVRTRPEVRGEIHAWVGIVAGGIMGLANLALIVLVLVGLAGIIVGT